MGNYKSIRTLQELNMTKTPAKEKAATNTFSIEVGESSHSLLTTATIYGANASGKSNLVHAVRTMRDIVVSSSKGQIGDGLPYDPFRLSKSTRNEPTELEAIFISEGVKYQYGFVYDENRILEEWLYAYPRKKAQKWFLRAWDVENQKYAWQFGRFFTGEKQVWVNSTRPNSLFLSTAVQLNSANLRPVFNWFAHTLQIATPNGWNINFSTSECEKSERKSKILDFMKKADASINAIEVSSELFDPSTIPSDMPNELKSMIIDKMKGEEVVELKFMKRDDQNDMIPFEVEEESDGTRRLFSFAGPWLDALDGGRVLVVDELNSNLHPLLVNYLVGFFHSKETNPNDAQLLFTTHETSILSQDVFRRDQVWFAEKDRAGASTIYSLSDFKPRKDRDDLESFYLSGAYGALPVLINERFPAEDSQCGDDFEEAHF